MQKIPLHVKAIKLLDKYETIGGVDNSELYTMSNLLKKAMAYLLTMYIANQALMDADMIEQVSDDLCIYAKRVDLNEALIVEYKRLINLGGSVVTRPKGDF